MLRASPVYRHQQTMAEFDDVISTTVAKIMNVNISEDLWKRISLPLAQGGWGIRSVADIALPCYTGSLSEFGNRSETLLPVPMRLLISKESENALNDFRRTIDPMPLPEKTSQRLLDSLVCQKTLTSIKESLTFARDKAVLIAACHPFSSKWLEALPSPHVATMLDPNSFRMAAALRVGAPVCEPFECRQCKATVDTSGLHPLSCSQSQGRRIRHSELNNLIHRAMTKAGYPSVLEPAGLCADSAKRPDGQTLPHWALGKSLVWDATVSCTVATSYVNRTAQESGWAAEQADAEKLIKYQELNNRFHVVPVAFETLGPISRGTSKFLKDLSRKISVSTGDQREGAFLRQHLSLAIQRGNIISIMGAMS